MKSCRLISLALAASAACATVPEPPRAPPFEGVKTIALVRWRAEGSARPRDPLDALKESLDGRGYATRLVELGRRPPEALRPVERLFQRMGSRVGGGPLPDRPGRVVRVGTEAEEAAAALQVDAVALYHRAADTTRFPAEPEPHPFPGPGFPPPPMVTRRPLGALSLVDAKGNAVIFDWGAPEEPLGYDPSAPVNAAEAIDALLRVLAGDPADGS